MTKNARWKSLRYAHSKERRRLARIKTARQRAQDLLNERVPADEVRIAAPEAFALEVNHHDAVAGFLHVLREKFLEGNKVICIDFRRTEKMVAGGTLLFFSELHRLKDMFPLVPLRCRPSKDRVVNEVLQHLGIFEALGYKSAIAPARSDVVSWRTVSSTEIDGEKVGTLLLKYESLSGPIAGKLFRGAGEAMFNVRHAYLAGREDGLPENDQKKWWMFCRESDHNIVVAVCDLGIGIPRSLPIKYPSEAISALISKFPGVHPNDAKMIHAAMEIRGSVVFGVVDTQLDIA